MSMLVLPYRCHDCDLRFFQFRWRKVATLWRQASSTRDGPAAVRKKIAAEDPAVGQGAAAAVAAAQDSVLREQATPSSAAMTPGSPLGEQATPSSAAATLDPALEHRAARRTAATARWTAGSRASLVLGVSEHATPEEVSLAYHRLARLYHPDRVAGLAPELQALAEKRMKEINAAYAVLKQRR